MPADTGTNRSLLVTEALLEAFEAEFQMTPEAHSTVEANALANIRGAAYLRVLKWLQMHHEANIAEGGLDF